MFFAIRDYLSYRRRTGRYSRDISVSFMGGAFEGAISETAIQVLSPGDVILVQNLDRFSSWVIMFLTQSDVSHVAMYFGHRKIVHAIPVGGVVIDSIEALYAPNTRCLPCKWPVSDEKSAASVAVMESHVGRPYGWLVVLRKGVNILTGRDWPCFRWAFFLDICAVALAIDGLLMLTFGHFTISWVIPIYVSVIAFNAWYWRVRPLPFNEFTAKPADMLSAIQAAGGSMLFDAVVIKEQVERYRSAAKR